MNISKAFDSLSKRAIDFVGSPLGFGVAAVMIVLWAMIGPKMHFSDTWELIINTITTIAGFLILFLIQQSQNKDTAAIQLKLNELIASNHNASNRLINIEDLEEDELEMLKEYYEELCVTATKIRGKKQKEKHEEV